MKLKDHEFCLRCGRKLKNPVAREKGYGIICERKMKVEYNKRLFEIDVNLQSSQKENCP